MNQSGIFREGGNMAPETKRFLNEQTEHVSNELENLENAANQGQLDVEQVATLLSYIKKAEKNKIEIDIPDLQERLSALRSGTLMKQGRHAA